MESITVKPMPLMVTQLNSIVDVEYSNGEKLKIKKWIRLNKGEVEIYVGDEIAVLAFTNTSPTSMEEIQQFALKSQREVLSYLISEAFIKENWIYIGLQNTGLEDNELFPPEE